MSSAIQKMFDEHCLGRSCRNCVIYEDMLKLGDPTFIDCYLHFADNFERLAPLVDARHKEEQEQNEEIQDTNDPVSHPSHYTFGTIEVIDAIEDWQLPFHLANVVKYVARAGKKDQDKLIEDLQKASWYLNRYIEYLTKDL